MYDLKYVPTTFKTSNDNKWPNHILTKIDLTDASVLEESFLCEAGKIPTSDGFACAPCDAGSFAVRGQTSCTTCGVGKYQGSAGKTSCDDIPAGQQGQRVGTVNGTYEASGASHAVDCKEGFKSDGTVACSSCPSGQTVASGGTTCTQCPVGTVRELNYNGGCTACVDNLYQDESGQASCKTCTNSVNDKYVSAVCTNEADTTFTPCGSCAVNGTTVQNAACVAGDYDDLGSAQTCQSNTIVCGCNNGVDGQGISGCTTCIGCDAGFTLTPGFSCTACPDGQYSNNGGTCTDCPAGKKGTGSGGNETAACTDCAAGKYLNIPGASSSTSCTNCAAGTYSHHHGATSVGSCTACDAGKNSPAASDDIEMCEWKVTMFGYVLMPDDPDACSEGPPCPCTEKCVRWHGQLTDGFDKDDIEVENEVTICALLKQDGLLLKAGVCD